MAHFRKIGTYEQAGYDSAQSRQLLPRGKETTFYLVAGPHLTVEVDDPTIVTLTTGADDDRGAHRSHALTEWENAQNVRKVKVKAGMALGSTTLRAKLNGADFAEPIEIEIVNNNDWREVGQSLGECSAGLREELQAMSLRDAVIRVAEDQLRSAVSCRSTGFGVYNIDANLDWCGAFAYWCWAQAAAIQGVANPAGDRRTVFWSPQRAIDWAMDPSSAGLALRYRGASPMTGRGRQEYIEVGTGGVSLEAGDIVLVRDKNASGWKHVALVEWTDGDVVASIDGNQGAPTCIKRRERSLSKKLADGSTALAFVHLLI